MTNLYNSAKNIMDFYMEKLDADINNPQAHYAQQYANLKLLKFRTSGIKDALESYDIEIDNA